jgi:hypothetical protein
MSTPSTESESPATSASSVAVLGIDKIPVITLNLSVTQRIPLLKV